MRFTTDYDGSKIMFKKRKEDTPQSLFSRVLVTERVVESKHIKNSCDMRKIPALHTNSNKHPGGFARINN